LLLLCDAVEGSSSSSHLHKPRFGRMFKTMLKR
jgi:hypothetical protein